MPEGQQKAATRETVSFFFIIDDFLRLLTKNREGFENLDCFRAPVTMKLDEINSKFCGAFNGYVSKIFDCAREYYNFFLHNSDNAS